MAWDGLPDEVLRQMLEPARRALAEHEREFLDRILAAGSTAAGAAAGRVAKRAGDGIRHEAAIAAAAPGEAAMAVIRLIVRIANLPHAAIEGLLDRDRGTVGVRALTSGEVTALAEPGGAD